MSKKNAIVKVREDGSYSFVSITSSNKPDICEDIISKWQNLIDICSRIMKIPSGLIMKLDSDRIEVFFKSNTEGNPYSVGETEELGIGLFCETVVAKKETLLVPDARNNKIWEDNPDIKLGMISYLGMPLLWPDNEVFGTICTLDNKVNHYNQDFIDLLLAFRLAIEADLNLLVVNKKMAEFAHTDKLTKIANRRSLDERMQLEFSRSSRYESTFSLILFDVDNFKAVNDTYGHALGDKILTIVAELTSERLRSIDLAGRFGGEEFLVICTETELEDAIELAEDIRRTIATYEFPFVGTITCSFGVSSYKRTDKDPTDALKRADHLMYKAKKDGKNKVL
ncbi:MAG: sensor domain-containing diguanylate cyclase [Desulfotalea sp.]